MTPYSLKIKYASAALGIGVLIALVLAGLLYWQHHEDATRLTGLAAEVVEKRLRAHLEGQATRMAAEAAQRLTPVFKERDWAVVQAIGNQLLENNDISGVDIKDAAGRLLFSAAGGMPGTAAGAPIRGTQEIAAPAGARRGQALGTLTLSLSSAPVELAANQLRQDVRTSERIHFQGLLAVLGTICGLLILCGTVIAWLMARRIERPITQLIRSAERIGQGDYSRPLSIVRKDEIGELQQALERMRIKLRQTTITKNYLNIVLNSMNDAVLVTSPDGTIKGVNDAARKLLGYSEEELIGKSLLFVIAEGAREGFSIDQAAHDTRETEMQTRAGQTIPVSFSGSVITTEDPQFQGSIFVARNITDRKRAERRIRYLARYDTLTKIPNRMQFQHLLQQALARAARSGNGVALLYLDMDRFKEVNDTFGHAAGDRTLEILTERLTSSLPKETVLGRLAGDEFALFLENLPRESSAQSPPVSHTFPAGTDRRGPVSNLARTLLAQIGKAFYLEQQEVFLTASIGVAFSPQDAENVIDLIRNADAAMYYSKQSGGNSIAFYSPEMNAAAVERLMLKSKLRRAVEREELVIQYQPKVDLRNGHIVGCEALLRWRLPGHGDISPSQFIPLAEETNLILDIGQWVLNKVCSDYRAWQRDIANPGRVAINLSLKQLKQASFITRFKTIFSKHDVSPTCFELEITETTLMADVPRTLKLLDELYAMGLHLSIDDFGTGYSSLSALQQFPIGTLKIDQSFVRDAAIDTDDATLVRTIIEMGRSMEMDVVAEGVESEEQLNFLRQHNCHYAQGRYLGDAVDAEEFLKLLQAQEAGNSNIVKLFG